MNGWHAAGLDLDERDFDAYAAFLRSWLTTKRLKHTAETTPVRRDGAKLGRRFHAEVGATKEEWKAGERHHRRLRQRRHPAHPCRAPGGDASTRSSPTRRTASSTAAAPAAGSRAARWTCCARPCPSGRRCSGRAARWASRGTPTSPPATTPWRCWPTRAWSRWTTAPTAGSSTASTRRSSATSSWREAELAGLICAHVDRAPGRQTGRPGPAAGLRRRPPQGRGDPAPGRGGGAHRPRRARRAARGGVRREDLRRPGPDHRRPAGARAQQPAGAQA